jgi:hypothetical protein
MVDKLTQAEIEARRTSYLKGLYTTALSGNIEAGDELSNIALGGSLMARDLVKQMDQKRIISTTPIPVVKSIIST